MKHGIPARFLANLLLMGAIAVVSVLVVMWSMAKAKDSTAVGSETEDTLRPVVVERVRLQTVEDQLNLTGRVIPWSDIMLSAEVAGRIEWQGVHEGELVTAGQELVRIDTQSLRTRLDQANAQAKLAEQEFERAQGLRERGVNAPRDIDNVRAALDVARADVRALDIQFTKSLVKAPMDGIIDTLTHDPDEFVDIGVPLVRLVQIDRVKVEVGVPERDVAHFTVGQAVHVKLDALVGQSFEGTIHRIATTADMTTHTFTTEVLVDNPDGNIRPGMIARATLVRKTYENSILAPIFSTFLLEDQRYAFVIEDGVARLRTLETGVVQGGSVQVLSGLEDGDLLVIRGQYDVREGDRVEVREEAA
jgi:membrane fusion protein, multidrug efflux system